MNQDGKIDWKEYSATIATLMTAYGGNKLDNEISVNDFKKWSASMGSGTDTTFAAQVRKSYDWLYNPKKD